MTISNLVALMCISLSCAPSTPAIVILVTPEYQRLETTFPTRLVVNLTKSELTVNNGPTVSDDIPTGEVKEVYLQFFRDSLGHALQKYSVFNEVMLLTRSYDTNFVQHEYPLEGDRKLSVRQPKDGYHFDLDPDSARFILFIESVKIGPKEGEYSFDNKLFSNSVMPTVTSPKLVQQTDFLIWDNAEGKVVSYGRTEVSDDFAFKVGMSNWRNDLRNTIEKVFDGTPFSK